MKNKIAEVFYDKEVLILNYTDSIDAEGGVKHSAGTVKDTFKGNVNFSKCKQIREEYGLDYDIDINITTSNTIEVKMNDIIQYDNICYIITDLFIFDSHILLVGNKWRQ